MLKYVAKKLGNLNDEVVYIGGSVTALFITDALSLDVRPTLDVDCIVDVATRGEYYLFCEKLRGNGFKQSSEDSVICRWRCDHVTLDVMPTEEGILTFGNRWYKEAVKKASLHQLEKNLEIMAITAPYFLATKMEAFKSRGNFDFLASHDFEQVGERNPASSEAGQRILAIALDCLICFSDGGFL
jgi:hypothetical protein